LLYLSGNTLKMRYFFVSACLLVTAFFGAAYSIDVARAASTVRDAIVNGRTLVSARLRFEHVDEDGFARNANAQSVRARGGYETRAFHGVSALVELSAVGHAGPTRFNDTVNGARQFPIIADPDGLELNQAYLDYVGIERTNIRLGRQAVRLSNQRFIGTSNFRQNQRTYDAISARYEHPNDWRATYAYLDKVHRVFGDDSPQGHFDTRAHLLQINVSSMRYTTVDAYAYLIDLPSQPALSSLTAGARAGIDYALWFNPDWTLRLTLEAAQQRDYRSNPRDYREHYFLVEPGIQFRGLSASVGWERLDGDGVNAVQTPFVSGHLFNGLTDKFVTIPGGGLDDRYLKLTYTLGQIPAIALESIVATAAYHDFESPTSGVSLGREWSAGISARINRHFSLSLEHARYMADSFSTDTNKTWATAVASY
jgi:hypothetical protein